MCLHTFSVHACVCVLAYEWTICIESGAVVDGEGAESWAAQLYPPSISNPPLAVFLFCLFVLTGAEIHFPYLSYAGWIHLNSLSAVFLPHGFVGVSVCDKKTECHTCTGHTSRQTGCIWEKRSRKVHGAAEHTRIHKHTAGCVGRYYPSLFCHYSNMSLLLSWGTEQQMRVF